MQQSIRELAERLRYVRTQFKQPADAWNSRRQFNVWHHVHFLT